jgi:hypothetical protein
MGDLRVGSKLSNPDGSISRVIAIYPLGQRQLYRVTFHDGTSCEVTDDHIWLAWRSCVSKRVSGVRVGSEESAQLWTTAQLIEKMNDGQRFLIPVTNPVASNWNLKHKPRCVDPYVLGVLLGDGSMGRGLVRFCTVDEEIAHRAADRVGHKLLGPYVYPDRTPEWRFPAGGKTHSGIKSLGLMGKNCFTKRIPIQYLNAPTEDRWELLRGLMDTDGWADLDGDIYYGTSAEGLRDDVAHLARSLGAVVTIRARTPAFTGTDGAKKTGETAYTLRIKLRDASLAFSLRRKKERCTRAPQSMNKAITSIEPSRIAEAQCIKVSHPNSLYITDDFIVTHNTDALLMDFAQHVGVGFGAAWRGILFRREYKELGDVVAKSKKWFRQIFPEARFLESQADYKWRWPTGEELLFRTAKRVDDYWSYHGHEYPWIGWEELTNWASPDLYEQMKSVCRSSHKYVPRKYRATTNPFGPGHGWVKKRFIDPGPAGTIIRSQSGMLRTRVHSDTDENKAMLEADPNYKANLATNSNEAQRKAWLDGSWDIVSGGLFSDVWDRNIHVLPHFSVPASWRIDRSFDWGSSTPFAVVWWAESDGTDLKLPDGRKMSTVRGDIFAFAEWYGWNGKPNEGLRMLATDIARGIIEREKAMGIHGRVRAGPADNQILKRENGMCLADDMKLIGVSWTESDKSPGSRVAGWETMRIRLSQAKPEKSGLPRERPGLFLADTCKHGILQISGSARSDKNPDEIHETAEDHWLDCCRYRLFSKKHFTGTARMTGFK